MHKKQLPNIRSTFPLCWRRRVQYKIPIRLNAISTGRTTEQTLVYKFIYLFLFFKQTQKAIGITVLRVQPWPPRIRFVQVFDRFLTSLMAVDHSLYTNTQSTEDNVFCFSRAFYHAIHQTCKKPVKNLYETYAGWTQLGAPNCNVWEELSE